MPRDEGAIQEVYSGLQGRGSAPGSVGDGSLTEEQLDALNVALRERYNRDGDGWITTTVLGGAACCGQP
jgi:hypothetical protein